MSRSYARFLSLAAVAAAIATAAGTAGAGIWNVDPAGTGDAATIQDAFDLAAPGDLIVLAPGTYQDDNTRSLVAHAFDTNTATAVAHMSPGVNITSSFGADVTFVDGEGVRHGLVGADLGTVEISGITFLDCFTAGSGGGTNKWGGGLLVFRSAPVVRNSRFVECVTGPEGGGGGLQIVGGANAVVEGNLFLRNHADDLGGGLDLFETSTATVTNNTFVRNTAGRSAGAFLINNTTVSVHNNVFASNSTTTSAGGAIGCFNNTSISASCNLFWLNTGPGGDHVAPSCGLAIGADDNIVADPLFCEPDFDNYFVNLLSPAAPGHVSGCGLRGAYDVGCGPVSVDATSWGRIKAAYR